MSRFNRLLASVNVFSRQFKLKFSLDFGSSRTRLMVSKKLVWDQPTLIAWHHGLQAVVAIGDQAAKLRGKVPKQIELIEPISKGVVAELDYAVLYLRAVLEQLQAQRQIAAWIIADCKLAVPANASPLARKQLRQVVEKVGWRVKQITTSTESILALPVFKKITQSHGIINLGAQTVEMGIFTGTQLFKAVTLTEINGDTFTQTIIDFVLAKHQLKIGWQMAEQLKHQSAAVVTVSGKDIQTNLVKVTRIEVKDFQEHLRSLATEMLADLKMAIDELPAGIIIQLQDQGFYLTGANSQVLDWASLLRESWQMPAITSADPSLDVVKGLANDK